MKTEKKIQSVKAPEEAVKRFRDARFGMFIHYGLYSLMNRREWAMYLERIPVAEYRKLMGRFNPENLDVSSWIRLAKDSGMKYACLTTRHHDGFCLFKTAETSFNSYESPAHRDLVREFVDACRAHDILPTLYYSVADWSDPGYTAGPTQNPEGWERFVKIVHAQLKELMSNYGPIGYLFYDGCPPAASWRAEELHCELRRLQPEMLISDRCRLDEDVASSEQHLKAYDKPWECCMTMNMGAWGCDKGQIHYRSAYELACSLATCMHNGGNFLLNVGPFGDGSIHPEELRLLKELGGWVNRSREAVYGTTKAPFDKHDYQLSCARGNTAYIAFHSYRGPETMVCGIGNKVRKIRLLATGGEISFRQEADRVFLTGLPEKSPDIMAVIAMELDGTPKGIKNPYQLDDSKFVF